MKWNSNHLVQFHSVHFCSLQFTSFRLISWSTFLVEIIKVTPNIITQIVHTHYSTINISDFFSICSHHKQLLGIRHNIFFLYRFSSENDSNSSLMRRRWQFTFIKRLQYEWFLFGLVYSDDDEKVIIKKRKTKVKSCATIWFSWNFSTRNATKQINFSFDIWFWFGFPYALYNTITV